MSATPASMLHIVASGLQDRERLNSPGGNPSIQFYSLVMRKRTRWASQWRRVDFDNLADFGRTAVATLPILGELITRATLVVVLPDIYTPQINAREANPAIVAPSWAWTNSLGHAICSSVQMLIGTEIIDQFDSRALEVLDEQTRPVEHFDSTDILIGRDPSTYSDQETIQLYPPGRIVNPQKNPQTLEVVFPFWWNRGPGPQALPIQALWKDTVQLKVAFRPAQQCVYTSTRVVAGNPPLSSNQGTGPMPNIAGCGFFAKDPAGTPIYGGASTVDLAKQGVADGFLGSVSTTKTMPTSYSFTDAYWIVEYVSLEDREASAYRMADFEIAIEQHIAMPIVTTNGSKDIRIRMDTGGLVRDLTWVAQRVEAPSYNAYFLFSRDLGPLGRLAPMNPPTNPADIPWWPNARIPNWDYGDGYIQPAFADRRSDPIAIAKMFIRALQRFEHESPSMFRSLIPALNCMRTPLIDRYIYRYDFGFWPTGGLAEALYLPVDQIRGCANWDKLPKLELALTMNQEGCSSQFWSPASGPPISTGGDSFILLDSYYTSNTLPDGLRVQLAGAGVSPNGYGARVEGVIDWRQLRQQQGYLGLYIRTNANGSASIVLEETTGYTWIAVAGAGGRGGDSRGGNAGDAVEIGGQGSTNIKTHNTGGGVFNNLYGGGGGGRLSNAGLGLPDGIQMSTAPAFVTSHTSTGGADPSNKSGGDGYYGGGSGPVAGGGGGSYVSALISQVYSYTNSSDNSVAATVSPLMLTSIPQPSFDIYAWVTRYNRLRITSGRGGLMFNETT